METGNLTSAELESRGVEFEASDSGFCFQPLSTTRTETHVRAHRYAPSPSAQAADKSIDRARDEANGLTRSPGEKLLEDATPSSKPAGRRSVSALKTLLETGETLMTPVSLVLPGPANGYVGVSVSRSGRCPSPSRAMSATVRAHAYD